MQPITSKEEFEPKKVYHILIDRVLCEEGRCYCYIAMAADEALFVLVGTEGLKSCFWLGIMGQSYGNL